MSLTHRLMRVILILTVAMTLTACEDDSNLSYPVTPLLQEPPRVTGIHIRDEVGNRLGTSGFPAGLGFAFPNPCGESVSVNLSAPELTHIRVWFVRAVGPTEDYQPGSLPGGAADRTPWGIPLLEEGTFIEAGGYVSTHDLQGLPDGFYRMYIVFAGQLFFDDILKVSGEDYAGW